MKRLSFLLFFVVAAMVASAQTTVNWTVNGGVGIANWSGDDADGTDAKFSWKLGVGMEVPFTDLWSLQTGLNLVSKGAKGKEYIEGYKADLTCNQVYLELPVMVGARVHTVSGFNLLFKAGPYFAYGVGGKTKAEVKDVEVSTDSFGEDAIERCDVGLGFGIIFELDKINVGMEASTGLTKLSSGTDARNMSVALVVGYRF